MFAYLELYVIATSSHIRTAPNLRQCALMMTLSFIPSQAINIIMIGVKNWLAQSQVNVTEWSIRSWRWWHGLTVGQASILKSLV